MWENSRQILEGAGATVGSYVVVRDKVLDSLDWGSALTFTAASCFVSGLIGANEFTATACGFLASTAIYKVASDFNLDKGRKHILAGLSIFGTGIATYLVATNKFPEGDVPSKLWENRGAIMMGAGATTAAYVGLRDKVQGNLGWKTAMKGVFGATLIAGGVLLGNEFPRTQKYVASFVSTTAKRISPQNSLPDKIVAYVKAPQLNLRDAPNDKGNSK